MSYSFPDHNRSPNYQPDKYKHSCPHSDCDRMFTSPSNVQQHLSEKHGGPLKHCGLCTKSFARNWALYRHMDTVHGVNIHPGRGKRGMKKKAEKDNDDEQEVREPKRRKVKQDQPVLQPPQPRRPWQIIILSDVPVHGDQNGSLTVEQTSETKKDHGLDEDNFADVQNSCPLCSAMFGCREDLLGHQHVEHKIAYSDRCDCMVCTTQEQSGIPFEAAAEIRGKNPGLILSGLANSGTAYQDMHDQSETHVNAETGARASLSGRQQESLLLTEREMMAETTACQPIDTRMPGESGQIDDSAKYGQAYFDYLDPGLPEWLGTAGDAFGAQDGDGTNYGDETVF